MSLDQRLVNLISLAALTAADCQRCVIHRMRMTVNSPNRDEVMHAIALAAYARTAGPRRAQGLDPEEQPTFGGIVEFHGIFFRPVLQGVDRALVRLGAFMALGIATEADIQDMQGVDATMIAEVQALALQAPARAVQDLLSAAPLFTETNAHYRSMYQEAGGVVEPPYPGLLREM